MNELSIPIESLVNYSIKNRTLQFSGKDIKIDFEVLNTNGIVRQISNAYHISSFDLFAPYFLHKYKEILKSQLTNDFNSYVQFLNKIEEDFNKDSYVHDFASLNTELWMCAILEANHKNDINFIDFTSNLDIEADFGILHIYISALGKALKKLNLTDHLYFELITIVFELLGKKENNDLYIYEFIGGIHDLVLLKEATGECCFEMAIQNEKAKVSVIIPIVAGLYELQGDFFKEKLAPLLDNKKYSSEILSGLAGTRHIELQDAKLFLNIFRKYKNSINADILQLSMLIISILKSDALKESNNEISEVFESLEEITDLEIHDINLRVFREIVLLKNHTDKKIDFVKTFISKSYFVLADNIRLIGYLFGSKSDITQLKEILHCIADFCPFQSIMNAIKNNIVSSRNSDKESFDKLVVELLISNKASRRFLGHDIFCNLQTNTYIFNYNILDLAPIDQYKLFVTVLQDFREPKFIVPPLLPLLKSTSTFVRETLLFKLEEYSESYGSDVVRILNKYLDSSYENHEAISDRIDTYNKDFIKEYITVKDGIKELDPYYTQNKIFVGYNRAFNRHFSSKISQNVENGSLMSFIPTIKLLKNGGWKNQESDNISKLTTIKSRAMSLPRTYFIYPEKFDYYFGNIQQEDWPINMFDEVNKILNDE